MAEYKNKLDKYRKKIDKKNLKFNKKRLMILGLIVFFIVYILSFNFISSKFSQKDDKTSEITATNNKNSGETLEQREILESEKRESNKDLIVRFKEANKIYIGDNRANHIKITGSSLQTFDRLITNFVKIRNVNNDFSPVCSGKSSNGVRFLTDFNYFELIDKNKTVHYKIPVSYKNDFQNLYRRLIYTSVEFITNGEDIGSIKVYSGNDSKSVWFWNKKELLNKLLYKREVGKIQPEKEFQKIKDNYTVKMDKSGVKISIQTMGKDFVKVTCGDNIAYYEVYPDLYTYLYNMFH